MMTFLNLLSLFFRFIDLIEASRIAIIRPKIVPNKDIPKVVLIPFTKRSAYFVITVV